MFLKRPLIWHALLAIDHTPSLECEAPWHAGIAFAVGYIKAAAKAVGVTFERGASPDSASTAVGAAALQRARL
jgi:mannonate dehydratase